jgi:hypothetical protein
MVKLTGALSVYKVLRLYPLVPQIKLERKLKPQSCWEEFIDFLKVACVIWKNNLLCLKLKGIIYLFEEKHPPHQQSLTQISKYVSLLRA